MAQKRMIDKRISVSEQVANLTRDAQLLYTWSIPHSDDVGLLPRNHKTLKGLIVPMWDIVSAEFDALVGEILGQMLWIPFEFADQKFYRIPNFTRFQTLKKDRQPKTILDIKLNRDPRKSWDSLEDIGFHVEDDEFQMESEEKGREGKRRKNTEGAGALKRIIKKRETLPYNPQVRPLIEFFDRSVKVIRGIEAPVNVGKVTALLKRRLLTVEADRIERMVIWYLTREKRYQDSNHEWQKTFKYSPDFGVMLSDAFFSQLLSDEANALTYIRDNSEWIDRLYEVEKPKREETVTGIGNILNRYNFLKTRTS